MSPHARAALAFGTLAALAAVAGMATAGQPATPRVVTTKGAIEALAMDGRRIAYDLEARGACNRLHLWDVDTGKDVVISGAGTCDADSTSTGSGVREIAVGGNRVSWIVNLGGNTESSDRLYAARLGVSGERLIASASRTGNVDGRLDGGWLGNLAGDGDLTALNRWTTAGGSLVASSIRRLTTGIVRIHTGDDSLVVMAADSGRIALLGGDGTVTVRDAEGEMLSTFAPIAPAREVALRMEYVVALEPGRLDVRLAATGEPVKTIAIPSGARHLDIHANIVTFSVARTVYAVRLATGRRITVAVAPKAIVDVEIDDAGLTYAYNRVTGVDGVGRLTFVPLSLLRSRLS